MSQSVFSLLHQSVQEALAASAIRQPTAPQEAAIPAILSGSNVLLIAPTGSGKTEAALLPILNELYRLEDRQGISVLYITPLRALNRDLLIRLNYWSNKLRFKVEVRHGDTPQKERRKQSIAPPDFLVTTPETLQAILPGKLMRNHLRHVRWVVIDEVHQLAGERRGAQLTVGLERLRECVNREFQTIGLSATVGNPEEIAAFITGSRKIEVIQTSPLKMTKYLVEYPHPTDEDVMIAPTLSTTPEVAARLNRIWELVEDHNSTLIFVNSRTTAETLGSKYHLLRRNVGVHHGSLPKGERVRVENDFKNGRIKALVCTSTLELGIDVGSVDLTVQYMSPRRVSNLIQRVGRSGHSMDRTSEGNIMAVSADDIIESEAAVRMAEQKKIEPLKIHEKALDVLAHQIAGIILESEREVTVPDLLRLIRRAYPYHHLTRTELEKVLIFQEKMRYVKLDGELVRRGSRTRLYYFQNLSMIPDERRYIVVDVSTHQSIGILGEEFMATKAELGLHFVIKGKIWQIEQISDDARVYVTPVEDPTAAIPGWDGQMIPLPFELAQTVGAIRGQVDRHIQSGQSITTLSKEWHTERFGIRKVLDELSEHNEWARRYRQTT
jgi:ATP-dependent Lhr-like helicase